MINKKNIIFTLIILIGIISVQKVLINKSESNISLEENKIAVYVDGEKIDTFPTKTSGKAFEKIECTNSGVAEWDVTNWKLTVKEINDPTVCNVYFTDDPTYLAKTFYGSLTKDSIESIIFEDHINVPSGVLGSWDASDKQNNTIKAWYTDTNSNGRYELVVGQVGGVLAPPDSSSLFSETLYLNILDLTNFDTSDVTNMWFLFGRTGYYSTIFMLDLGDRFDTSNVIDMGDMFYYVGYSSPQFILDLGDKFNTSKVTTMHGMFTSAGWSSPTFTLDLGDKFDTCKVTDMLGMFQQAGYSNKVFSLNLGSKFDASKVTNYQSMFANAGFNNHNFYIDARYTTWNPSADTTTMFHLITTLNDKVYVKDAAAMSFVQNAGSANYIESIVNCSVTSCPS